MTSRSPLANVLNGFSSTGFSIPPYLGEFSPPEQSFPSTDCTVLLVGLIKEYIHQFIKTLQTL